MLDPTIKSTPNCVITVHFDESTSRFTCCCAASSSNWQVDSHGNIDPPSQSRIIQFSLKPFPREARFAGFQLAEEQSDLRPEANHWPALPEGVTALAPQPYPPVDGTTPGPLIFDFGTQSTQYSYRLAVVVGDGLPHWMDPKIYDDGSFH